MLPARISYWILQVLLFSYFFVGFPGTRCSTLYNICHYTGNMYMISRSSGLEFEGRSLGRKEIEKETSDKMNKIKIDKIFLQVQLHLISISYISCIIFIEQYMNRNQDLYHWWKQELDLGSSKINKKKGSVKVWIRWMVDFVYLN